MAKVAVSACLLGRACRYDGKDKRDEELLEELEGHEVIPFCPEEAVLGVPRETIDIVQGRMIGNETGRDYTEQIEAQAKKFIASYPEVDLFYCKSKSPSCALASAREYDRDGRLLRTDACGIFAKSLKKWYKKAIFKER